MTIFNQTGRVSLTFWKKLGRVNSHVVFFQIFDRFRLDEMSFDLRSGRIQVGPISLTLKKKTD
jgi:hypothetical protein